MSNQLQPSHRLLALAITLVAAATSSRAWAQPGDAPGAERLAIAMRGVQFVPNRGQWADKDIEFGFRSRGLDIAFRESSLTMHLAREEESLTLAVSFPGANDVTPTAGQPLATRFNYFVGGEGRHSVSGVPSFATLVYPNLYDGIDLHVMGSETGVLKYEFHCAPGSDYGQIQIRYDGADSLCVNDNGDLHINTTFGTLTDGAPVVWQQGPTERTTIPALFELIDANTYRIALTGPVDLTRELIIDPDVDWMTYLGGTWDDRANDVAVDEDGYALVTGETGSVDFEGRRNQMHGEHADVFVVKVNPSGNLEWMTYLGGSGTDEGEGIAIDGAGNLLVTGSTTSADFDARNNSHHGGEYDAFLAKLDSSGIPEWMTYLGGSHQWDYARYISVDAPGNAIVTGYTNSTDFEGGTNSHHGDADAFIVKVDANGIVQWMTYLGGSGEDLGYGVALDRDGSCVATGRTGSSDFEGASNSPYWMSDAFVTRVDPNGAIVWMSYLGGNRSESGTGIALDSEGSILIAGDTESTNFYGRVNSRFGHTDAFAMKLSASGVVQWMTYLGGSRDDWRIDIAVDSTDHAFVTGQTDSRDFDGRTNSYHGGSYDAFIVKIRPSGSRSWMTYLGGGSMDIPQAVAIDGNDDALIAGRTFSTDFEGRNNASRRGGTDAFVVKVLNDPERAPILSVAASCPAGGPIRVGWSQATPAAPIGIVFARSTGSVRIPPGNPCAGTELGLSTDQLRLVYQGTAGPEGSRTLISTVGPGACGAYLQLLDIARCNLSNVARIE